jgi:GTPase
VIHVPAGTVVRNEETGEVLADLTQRGQQAMVARGGRGGLGNTHFATATNQAPREAQRGEPGEEVTLLLELKLIADVGLVGLPNAGKSTLLAAVTAARPKIANYPFTTLTPNLGVVMLGEAGDSQSFVMADIPGLIEGAAEGVGLGHDFLRHVERTRLLLHLVDGDNIVQDPWDELELINRELEAYSPKLAALPQILVFTKMDLPSAQERWPAFQARAEAAEMPVFAISAPTRQGVDALMDRTAEMLRELPAPDAEAGSLAPLAEGAILRPRDDESFTIDRDEDGAWNVHGKRVERLAYMTPTETVEGLARLEKHLRRMGIFDALAMYIRRGAAWRHGALWPRRIAMGRRQLIHSSPKGGMPHRTIVIGIDNGTARRVYCTQVLLSELAYAMA